MAAQGAPIPGATQLLHVTPEDAGRDVSATVFASATGFDEGASTTAAVAVARMTSTVTGTLKANRIKAPRSPSSASRVTVPGLTTPTGTIQVLDKGKKVAQITMAPVHKGVKMIKIKKLKKGKHKLRSSTSATPRSSDRSRRRSSSSSSSERSSSGHGGK